MNRVALFSSGFYRTPKIGFDRDSGKGLPFFYFSNGVSCSEVMVDCLTGEYRVTRVDVLHDTGNSLNPALDIGQVEGAFVQGMGWLTTEELKFDGKGHIMSNSPANYKIPTAFDVPEDFRVQLYNRANPEATVFRSKAVGEPPLLLPISVWCALRDACASVADYRYSPKLDTPATAEAVYWAMQDAKQWAAAKWVCTPKIGQTPPQSSNRAGTRLPVATVIATSGSTPRAAGSKMVISSEHSYDTLGGGQLEFLVQQRARQLLAKDTCAQEIKQFPLGAEAKQCCGGSVTILLEVFASNRCKIAVFGAGHVAVELTKILAALPCAVVWVDNRSQLLEQAPSYPNTQKHWTEEPEHYLQQLPSHTQLLILTHDHALDYRLVASALKQERFANIGLIGSATKARRFSQRLKHDGFSAEQIATLTCPVGLPDIAGKLPMEVAVSIAAQVIQTYQHHTQSEQNANMNWREMKQSLALDKTPTTTTKNNEVSQ